MAKRTIPNDMLVVAEHPVKGIWYFTNYNIAAEYTGVAAQNIRTYHKGKGWTFNYTDDGDIPFKYINPMPEDIKMDAETKLMHEALMMYAKMLNKNK